MTPAGQWSLTATSTSTVNLKADTTPTAGGTVLSVTFTGQPFCSIAVKGPISVTGLSYSNATHALTFAKNTIPIQAVGPAFCAELYGTSMTISGTFAFPGNLTILP
jgi:hypothetical protein